MKQSFTVTLVSIVLSAMAGAADAGHARGFAPQDPQPRRIDAVVSVQWLENNLGVDGLVVLDVRPADAHEQGHIPGAVSEPFVVPFSAWITMRDDLLLEIPDTAALFASLGALGITAESSVVVVSASNPGEPPEYGLANATRVAMTLIYAGVSDVAVLDGGYTSWVEAGLPVTDETPVVEPVVYAGPVNEAMLVSRAYVERRMGSAVIIDARDPDVYFGATVEPFAPQPGHIPTARSLPAPFIWPDDRRYGDPAILGAMAEGVIGWNRYREVIVYCGVGGYASSWWYLLSQMLGYHNVKVYDGSAQEWVRTNGMIPYRWY